VRGLDRRIHLLEKMDGRIKSGHDIRKIGLTNG
jgi:hypothetical protein